jgi:hypothetical protein
VENGVEQRLQASNANRLKPMTMRRFLCLASRISGER